MMKFIAPTVEAAKAKARRALGEGAHIVSVRSLPSGDVEVSASDSPDPAAPAAPYEQRFGDDVRQVFDAEAARGRMEPIGARLNAPLEQKFSESALARLSNDLVARGRGSTTIDMSDRKAAALAEALRPHGFTDALIADIIAGARRAEIDDDLFRLEQGLAETFSFAPLAMSPMTPIMLVGPTGAGKTSCSAKLAATAINRGLTAFIMTADVGRAGAIDQIKAYGDALGADYYITETPIDVAQALKSKRPNGAVILDTPGISPYDTGDFAALRSFQEATQGEVVIVLPASGDVEEYREWAAAFREFGARRMVITKFDATRRVGAALAAAHAAGLTLAHFSQSPFISEGLVDATPEYLARRLLAGRAGRLAH